MGVFISSQFLGYRLWSCATKPSRVIFEQIQPQKMNELENLSIQLGIEKAISESDPVKIQELTTQIRQLVNISLFFGSPLLNQQRFPSRTLFTYLNYLIEKASWLEDRQEELHKIENKLLETRGAFQLLSADQQMKIENLAAEWGKKMAHELRFIPESKWQSAQSIADQLEEAVDQAVLKVHHPARHQNDPTESTILAGIENLNRNVWNHAIELRDQARTHAYFLAEDPRINEIQKKLPVQIDPFSLDEALSPEHIHSIKHASERLKFSSKWRRLDWSSSSGLLFKTSNDLKRNRLWLVEHYAIDRALNQKVNNGSRYMVLSYVINALIERMTEIPEERDNLSIYAAVVTDKTWVNFYM